MSFCCVEACLLVEEDTQQAIYVSLYIEHFRLEVKDTKIFKKPTHWSGEAGERLEAEAGDSCAGRS